MVIVNHLVIVIVNHLGFAHSGSDWHHGFDKPTVPRQQKDLPGRWIHSKKLFIRQNDSIHILTIQPCPADYLGSLSTGLDSRLCIRVLLIYSPAYTITSKHVHLRIRSGA